MTSRADLIRKLSKDPNVKKLSGSHYSMYKFKCSDIQTFNRYQDLVQDAGNEADQYNQCFYSPCFDPSDLEIIFSCKCSGEVFNSNIPHKVCIFGCTADPFTPAHLAMVEAVLERVNKVIIIPTIIDYYRSGKSKWLTDEQRLEVIKEFANRSKCSDRIIIDDDELKLKDRLSKKDLSERRFYHTLKRIKNEYADNTEVSMLIGSDSYKNFGTWYKYDEILSILGNHNMFVVIGRNCEYRWEDLPKYKFIDKNGKQSEYYYNVVEIDPVYRFMSATKIREKYSDYKQYVEDMKDENKVLELCMT